MSNRSVIASSSSSRSRSVSWQPSQEVELDDADARAAWRDPARGRRHQMPSRLKRRTELGEREDRAVAADEEPAQLAVAAQPDAALHVPLEGNEDPVRAEVHARGASPPWPASSVPGRRRRRPPRARPSRADRTAGSRRPTGPVQSGPRGRRSSASSMSRRRAARLELRDVAAGRPASAPRGQAHGAEPVAPAPGRRRSSGRSGARPMPPATITTSRPSAASTGQPGRAGRAGRARRRRQAGEGSRSPGRPPGS